MGDVREHYERDDTPISFRGRAGCLITGDVSALTYPAQADGHGISFIPSTTSSCSVINEKTLERIKRAAGTAFYEQYPYKLGCRPLNEKDDVEICDAYTSNIRFNIVGICKVPLKLPDNVDIVHDCFVMRGMVDGVDAILSVNEVTTKHNLGLTMSFSDGSNKAQFYPR